MFYYSFSTMSLVSLAMTISSSVAISSTRILESGVVRVPCLPWIALLLAVLVFYVRYRLKTLFNDKLGIWLEAHLYTGMDFPRVTEGNVTHTDFDGLRHAVTYGFQLSPVITYQFNRKSTFQMFFSILSLGYSGTAYCYTDHNEYTNDVIIFSGKLSNLIANHFTPGLYGLKFGIQKSF